MVVTAASRTGKGVFDESVMLEAAPVANEVRSHITQKCAELAAERLTLAELAALENALATFEDAIAREDMAAAKAAHDRFYALFLTGRAQSAAGRDVQPGACRRGCPTCRRSTRASTIRGISPHHRALLRALRKRDKRAAKAVVRKHFQSLGQMLEVVRTAGRSGRAGRRSADPGRKALGTVTGYTLIAD